MGLFNQLSDPETKILAAKLMSGAETLHFTSGIEEHDAVMDLYDTVGEVQKNYKRDNGQ